MHDGGCPGGSVGIRRAAGHSGTGKLSAGGTIINAPGKFDAKKPLDSADQTKLSTQADKQGASSFKVLSATGNNKLHGVAEIYE
ncbi:DUF1471 domain-containing protein [Escherichia coli]|nr:DUF1471 domain-containing protein [Escherichia coli]EHR8987552.1 DUF1471 domain-containing protein [Escherichia coli]EHR9097456.1 DUF1471 domain-containing protein [Escherichia coli]EIM2920959.1 DUF1471 domain-containing protein [Escherichia coli]EIP7908309.1 DUF1471 domain-containing protein [Escherichia coli]